MMSSRLSFIVTVCVSFVTTAAEWTPISDQRPAFHFMPREGFTNDIQGPFYDPLHKLYHMGFAWHPNSTTFGGSPNRWYHIVSRDLATWQVVSTTPDKAMISPGPPGSYDGLKPTTGSVTIVDGKPMALYSCNSNSGTHVALAWPEIYERGADPLLTNWTKYFGNPVMKPPAKGGFRDPSTAWLSKGLYRIVTQCGKDCAPGKATSAAMYSSADFLNWNFTGTLYDWDSDVMECPDFFEASNIILPGTLAPARRLHVLKYSLTQSEYVIIGTYDEEEQRLVDLVAEPQRLDYGDVYASKSFWDPVNQQRIWSGWLREGWTSRGACVNVTVCNTHTLPRAMLYDVELKRMVLRPIPQLAKLRKKELASLTKNETIVDGRAVELPAVNGMQLEIVVSFAIPDYKPPDQMRFSMGIATRLSKDGQQRTECSVSFDSIGEYALETSVWNTGAVVDTPARRGNHRSMPLPMKPSDKNITLRCFVDHSAFEAYAMDGRAVISSRTYPLDDANAVEVFAKGADATMLDFHAWELNTIWQEQADMDSILGMYV